MKKYPFYPQLDSKDCGPACLRNICKYYGKVYSSQRLRKESFVNRQGTTLAELSEAAENIGFKSLMAKVSMHRLKSEMPLPLIANLKGKHYVVVYEATSRGVIVADPEQRAVDKWTFDEFKSKWLTEEVNGTPVGIVLLLEPTPAFYETEDEKDNTGWGLSRLAGYLKPYYPLLFQLLLGMLAGSILQLFFPLLTQSIVDKGITTGDIGFVNLILLSQLALVAGRMMLAMIQNRIFVYMNGRLSLSILSHFLIKLMKLRMSFFESRHTGDILQRISDNNKVQSFLTGTTLSVIFSVFNILLYGLILAYYDTTILLIFAVGTAAHTGWVTLFLGKRRQLNYQAFDNSSRNQSTLIQLINGMQEIKLNNFEKGKRWEWERVQTKAYRLGVKSLNINQAQQAGSLFINETKGIIITYLTVTAVMRGDITLGMMMSVQYIIGSLNAPINSMVGLIQTVQDVKISLERIGEIHNEKEEEQQIGIVPSDLKGGSLVLKNVSFQYGGADSPYALRSVSLTIPFGKVTAIVGTSGSGKSTLLKLLLGIHDPRKGEILIGDKPFSLMPHRWWREKCAAVMQDGFIFNDTIARNIAMRENEDIEMSQLIYAAQVANIYDHIKSLPKGFQSLIGSEGIGLSQGQKQRLLIARAVYKDPEFLFLDEATNALDANNETEIMSNLRQFFEARTVLIVAHRLSTVINADHIIVMDDGQVKEQGDHLDLVGQQGLYYSLIRNQLELG